MSATTVADMYNHEFKVNISPRLLQHYVQHERVGSTWAITGKTLS